MIGRYNLFWLGLSIPWWLQGTQANHSMFCFWIQNKRLNFGLWKDNITFGRNTRQTNQKENHAITWNFYEISLKKICHDTMITIFIIYFYLLYCIVIFSSNVQSSWHIVFFFFSRKIFYILANSYISIQSYTFYF